MRSALESNLNLDASATRLSIHMSWQHGTADSVARQRFSSLSDLLEHLIDGDRDKSIGHIARSTYVELYMLCSLDGYSTIELGPSRMLRPKMPSI